MMKSLIAFTALCLMGMGTLFGVLEEPVPATTCLLLGMLLGLPCLDTVRD